MSLSDDVRAACAEIAATARSVRIDLDALALDAINFGSGWFPTLRKRRGPDGTAVSGYFTVAWGLADRFRALGPWTNAELRAMRTEEIADVLGQARGSAVRLAEMLAAGMAMFDDRGFYKRAQIAGSDLALAGVAAFDDIDRLTIFADNPGPHVLRVDGVLRYDERLAAHIDAGRDLRPGPQEREIRACAVHACALLAERTGMTERDIDNALWTRGGRPEYKAIPRHRCRTIYY